LKLTIKTGISTHYSRLIQFASSFSTLILLVGFSDL